MSDFVASHYPGRGQAGPLHQSVFVIREAFAAVGLVSADELGIDQAKSRYKRDRDDLIDSAPQLPISHGEWLKKSVTPASE